MEYRITDMRCKEVINISDGQRLGYIYDVLFSTDTGKITAVILPGQSRMLGLLGREEDYMIPWESIKRISQDVVLVDVKQYVREKRKKSGWL